jgi:hypothetical protein
LPSWPNATVALFIERDNLPNCEACYQLNFQGQVINLLALDHAPQGISYLQHLSRSTSRPKALIQQTGE